ncbi:unnamed protein product [Amoebophrya sp. A120]|nr:unnamed protein product [Amoebophrya sp. A120]|eukprot:GSA120T00004747001.1
MATSRGISSREQRILRGLLFSGGCVVVLIGVQMLTLLFSSNPDCAYDKREWQLTSTIAPGRVDGYETLERTVAPPSSSHTTSPSTVSAKEGHETSTQYAFIDSDGTAFEVFRAIYPGAHRFQLYTFDCSTVAGDGAYNYLSHFQLGAVAPVPVGRLPCEWKAVASGSGGKKDKDTKALAPLKTGAAASDPPSSDSKRKSDPPLFEWLRQTFSSQDEIVLRIGPGETSLLQLAQTLLHRADERQKLLLDGLPSSSSNAQPLVTFRKLYLTEDHLGSGAQGDGTGNAGEQGGAPLLGGGAFEEESGGGPNFKVGNAAAQSPLFAGSSGLTALLGNNRVLLWPQEGNPSDMLALNSLHSNANHPVLRTCIGDDEEDGNVVLGLKIGSERGPAQDFVNSWLAETALYDTAAAEQETPSKRKRKEKKDKNEKTTKSSGQLAVFVFADFVEQFPDLVRNWQKAGLSVQARIRERAVYGQKEELERELVQSFRIYRRTLDPAPKLLLVEDPGALPTLLKVSAGKLDWQLVQPRLVIPPIQQPAAVEAEDPERNRGYFGSSSATASLSQLLADPLENAIRKPLADARQEGGLLLLDPLLFVELVPQLVREANAAEIRFRSLDDCRRSNNFRGSLNTLTLV